MVPVTIIRYAHSRYISKFESSPGFSNNSRFLQEEKNILSFIYFWLWPPFGSTVYLLPFFIFLHCLFKAVIWKTSTTIFLPQWHKLVWETHFISDCILPRKALCKYFWTAWCLSQFLAAADNFYSDLEFYSILLSVAAVPGGKRWGFDAAGKTLFEDSAWSDNLLIALCLTFPFLHYSKTLKSDYGLSSQCIVKTGLSFRQSW